MVLGKGGNDKLISRLHKRRDELRQADDPVQITGLQMIHVIRDFFRIGAGETVQYELGALMELSYPGDAKLGPWKDRWDKMMRHLTTKLTDADKLSMFRKKLADSARLKSHLDHLERIPKTHPDYTYTWLSNIVDNCILDDQEKENQHSLILEASG